VEDAVLVEVLEAEDHAGNKKLGLLFVEAALLANVEAEVAAVHQVNDQVEVVPVLKGVLHVDEEGVVELDEEFLFVHDGVDGALADDAGFGHFLEGEGRLGLGGLDAPDLAEAAAPDHALEVETLLRNSLEALLFRFCLKIAITHIIILY